MTPARGHLDTIAAVAPSGAGSAEYPRTGRRWVYPRIGMACGHIGRCDSSPGRHATAHRPAHPDHPIARSFAPGEHRWRRYPDELAFAIVGAAPAPAHP